MLSAPAFGDTVQLKADACLWPRWYYSHQTDYLGLEPVSKVQLGFPRVTSFLGLTTEFTEHLSARFYGDIGDITGRPVLDLFARADWYGVTARFGQFRLPLTDEILAQPWTTDFIDYTVTSTKLTPSNDFRDVGLEADYTNRFLHAALALVNGNGRQIRDNNKYKDAVFRLKTTPLGENSLALSGGFYLGADTLATNTRFHAFRRFLFSGSWVRPGYFARADYAFGADSMKGMNSISVAGGFRHGWVQPVVRYERFVPFRENLPIATLTLGLNAFLVQDMIKPMLNFTWTQDKTDETDELKLTLQVQAAFW